AMYIYEKYTRENVGYLFTMDSSDEESPDNTIVFQAVTACVRAVGEYCCTYMFKQPARHGDDERARFINSIIRASDGDCVDQLRMNRDTFLNYV
ncbi:hypothetical protein PJI17_31525, partial [Mycobacterium kansasii]